MKKAENIALWTNRFTERKASGLKVDEWCEKNNISRHAYYYWHRKIQNVPQHASEKMFIEIPITTSEGKSKTEQEGIVITWKEFSFCMKDFQEIPLITDLMQRLVKEC